MPTTKLPSRAPNELHNHRQNGLRYWRARTTLDLAGVVRTRDQAEADELTAAAARFAQEHGFGGVPLPAEG